MAAHYLDWYGSSTDNAYNGPKSLCMQENEIGQDFALFYMAYSAFMELRGNFGKAEAIFQKGLTRFDAFSKACIGAAPTG